MEKEEWKSVVGYEGYFEVSNYGKVRSLPREVIKSNGKIQKVHGQELSLFIRDSSKIAPVKHYRIALQKNGKRKKYFVHRLVATAFIRPPEENEIINHIDNNGLNNYYKNLEWCTHKENVAHCYSQNRQNREKVLEAQAKTVAVIKQKKMDREIARIGKTYGFLTVTAVLGFDTTTKTQDIQVECTCKCGEVLIKPSRAFRLKSIMMCNSCKKEFKHLKDEATINKNLI
jgi:ribosomal protein L44E